MALIFALLLLVLPTHVWAGAEATPMRIAAVSETTARPLESPQAVVQKLYADHFMHDMGFTRASAARKKNWLTPGFNQQIDAYLRRPASPDLVPAINGDPFTDTQEYPTSFSVGNAAQDTAKANVPVVMTIGTTKRTVWVQLVRQTTGWLVDDILYDDGTTFRAQLKANP